MPSSVKNPRGKSKSGRVWRAPGERSGNMIMGPGLKSSWRQRLVERAERKAMKEREHELKETAKREREERRQKIEEKRQRKLENERKGEVVQKITNAAKLKRLSKKQMRSIQKRKPTENLEELKHYIIELREGNCSGNLDKKGYLKLGNPNKLRRLNQGTNIAT